MKKLINMVKTVLTKLFKKEQPTPQNVETVKTAPKAVVSMDRKYEELQKTLESFDKNIAKLQASYDQLENAFEKQYQELVEIHLAVRQGKQPESDAEAKQAEIEPLKLELNDAGHHLEMVKGYKREAVIELATDMQDLSKDYTLGMASITKELIAELKESREQYLDKLNELALHYKQISNTETGLTNTLLQNGVQHKPTIAENHNGLTKDIQLSMHGITVSPETVNTIFRNPRQ